MWDSGIVYLREYGRIVISLKDVMDKQGITRNRMTKLADLNYPTVDRYYKSAPITSVDLDILAKLCFVLNCEVEDILKYERPESEEK